MIASGDRVHFHGDGCPNRDTCVDAQVNAIFPVEGEPESHIDHAACWCRPAKTYTDPVTETEVWVHRYVLEHWEDEGGPDPEMARAIVKIEAESRSAGAAPLDVEVLRQALFEQGSHYCDPGMHNCAKAIRNAYTRLLEAAPR